MDRFDISPDGSVFYRCNRETAWRSPTGALSDLNRQQALAFNDHELALTVEIGTEYRTLALRSFDPTVPPLIVELPELHGVISARAVADGFLLALNYGIPEEGAALWHLSLDGTLEKKGIFSPIPSDHNVFAGAIDGNGSLWQQGQTSTSSNPDVIFRRAIGHAVSDVVYTEVDEPLVKMHVSSLVTGPGGARFSSNPTARTPADGLPNLLTASDVFDPKRVYLDGTLSEGACYRDAIADPLLPDVGSIGFGCNVSNRTIRPSDGHLFYRLDSGEVREFKCDLWCQYLLQEDYPTDPELNDPQQHLVGCADDRASIFGFSPDGSLYYQCNGEDFWRNHIGTKMLYGAGAPLAFHNSGAAIIQDGPDLRLDLADGSLTDIGFSGPLDKLIGIRGIADGFWLAVKVWDLNNDVNELWHVDLQGNSTLLGTYPPAPAGTTIDYSNALDSNGDLWQAGRTTDLNDVIIRRTMGASTGVVVYDEMTTPVVKMHSSHLLSGDGRISRW